MRHTRTRIGDHGADGRGGCARAPDAVGLVETVDGGRGLTIRGHRRREVADRRARRMNKGGAVSCCCERARWLRYERQLQPGPLHWHVPAICSPRVLAQPSRGPCLSRSPWTISTPFLLFPLVQLALALSLNRKSRLRKPAATSSGERRMLGWFSNLGPVRFSCCASRLGQEPPPPPAEDAFDGRSLAEVSPQFLATYVLC